MVGSFFLATGAGVGLGLGLGAGALALGAGFGAGALTVTFLGAGAFLVGLDFCPPPVPAPDLPLEPVRNHSCHN